MLEGRCHCGSIRFTLGGPAVASSACYCDDCCGHSGAPVVAWALVDASTLTVSGEPAVYRSSATGRRSFCGTCGTGLFFSNAVLDDMGMVQVRIATLADPEAIAPKVQVQVAERAAWMAGLLELPAFARFPD